ncbi:MAG: DUF4149 domain-containing protein [bacterium]|nr:DUF4149 domain-containing protein [bacterium]
MGFVHLSYWFDIVPFPLQGWKFWVGLAVLILFVVDAIVLFVLSRKVADDMKRRLFRRLFPWSATFGLVWAVLFFFRQEQAYFLSARFLPLLLVIIMAWWLVMIFRRVRKIPAALERERNRHEFEHYIPKRAE